MQQPVFERVEGVEVFDGHVEPTLEQLQVLDTIPG